MHHFCIMWKKTLFTAVILSLIQYNYVLQL
jgi:hypothetical protein